MNRYLTALRTHIEEKPEALFCRQIANDHDLTLSWGALGVSMGQFSAAYRSKAVPAGGQVLIFLRHVPELYGAFFGAMATGLTPAFLPCTSPRQDVNLYWKSHRELLAKVQPAAIVTNRSVLSEMAEAGLSLDGISIILIEELVDGTIEWVDSPDEAIALLQHSSGTTGLKKGVTLSYGAIVAQIESYAGSLLLQDDDAIASWLPLYHDMGLIACMITPAYFGMPVAHIDPFYWVSKPASLLDVIMEERATLCWLPNFAFEHLAATVGRHAARYDLAHVRAFISCSEPVKAASFDRFASAFAPAGVVADQLQCCYAMAEAVFAVSQTPLKSLPKRITVKPDSLDRGKLIVLANEGLQLMETGTPIDGLDVTIVDEQRTPLPGGTVGEITITGDFLFSGYNRDPQTTAERLENGQYYTRDIGFLHDGALFVLGRTDDLIIINGRNLYAHEIEAALAGIDGLKPGRAVAVSLFDDRIGSNTLIIIAEKRKDSALDPANIRTAISNRILSIFEVTPRAIELADEGTLIKTTSGKISRSENLKRYLKLRG